MEDIIDIIVTETTNTIEITAQPNDEIIDVNIIDNREDVTLNVTPTVVEININTLTGNFGVFWGDIQGTLSDQEDLQDALDLKADLVDGKVPSSQLPSYVDDVVEVANYAALPAVGETGKIYITLDTNFIYRWTGSTYVEIKDSSAVWGAITGTLSNQTDLQNALNAKLNVTTAASTYVPYTGATANVNLGTRDLTADAIYVTNMTAGDGAIFAGGANLTIANWNTGGVIAFRVDGGQTALTINADKSASFISAIAATFATFTEVLTGTSAVFNAITADYGISLTNIHDSSQGLLVRATHNDADLFLLRLQSSNGATSETWVDRFTVSKSGVATFSNSVTANSFIKSGGTSSQFLKADGSVDSTSYQPTLTNPVTGTGTSGQVAFWDGTSSVTGDTSLVWDNTNKRLGIGVASPAAKLEINGGTNASLLRLSTATRDATFSLDSNGYITVGGTLGAFTTLRSFANLFFAGPGVIHNTNTGGGTGMKIIGSGSTTGFLDLQATSGSGNAATHIKFLGGSNGATEIARFLSSGNVVIGATSDNGARLQVTGTATISSSITANSFIKSGGTSSQFLKADGSVDSSTYLTTDTASSTYLALAGGTLTGAVTGTRLVLAQNSADITLSIVNSGTGRAFSVLGTSYFSADISFGSLSNGVLKANALGALVLATAGTDYQAPLSGTGFVKISGSTISYDNSTYLTTSSASSTYLALAGGTLTGALNGTSAVFTSTVRANNPAEGATGEGLIAGQSFKIDGTGTSQKAVMYLVSNVLSDTYGSGLTAQFANFAGDKAFGFNLNTSGGFELYVKNTSFNKALTIANNNAVTLTGALSGTSASFSSTITSTNERGFRSSDAVNGGSSWLFGANSGSYYIGVNGGVNALIIANSGAATFSSSVTATSVRLSDGNEIGWGANTTFLLGDSANNNFRFFTNNTEKVRITSAGNVGIGTAAPSFATGNGLSVTAGATDTRITLKNTASGDTSTDGFQLVLTTALEAVVENRENASLRFSTNATEAMRITAAGNVLIGKTTGTSKFAVVGLPTSATGLASGDFYQSAGVVMVVP